MTAHHTEAELLAMLRKAVNATRAVMVGVSAAAPSHFCPMKGHAVEGEGPVWFICRRDAALVRELGGESCAGVLNVVNDDHHLHASVLGELTAERAQGRIDQFWTSVADAWLPEGRTSPDVILLRFDPAQAEIWLSDNSFKLAWEVAKANLNRQQITSGEKATVQIG